MGPLSPWLRAGMNLPPGRATIPADEIARSLLLRLRPACPEALRACRGGRLCSGFSLATADFSCGDAAHRACGVRASAGDGDVGLVLPPCQAPARCGPPDRSGPGDSGSLCAGDDP